MCNSILGVYFLSCVCVYTTAKPLNKGHLGDIEGVVYSVVALSEVTNELVFIQWHPFLR